jgi:2-iminobutanoate/2-iminopropanoate deaminase
MQFIETPLAPPPAGHYSQAVVANGFVFVSGVLPLSPGGDKILPAGIEAQCEQVFTNLRHVLEASGSSLQHLVNVQVFIPDVALWPDVNATYQRMLGAHKPARTVVPCGALHYGALIEINAVGLISSPG